MRARTRTRLILVAAVLAASSPLLAPPARADDFAAEITSFERISPSVLGGHALVALQFTAEDEGPAGLMYANFEFETPLGGFVRADSPYMGRASSGTYTATHVLSPWAASGTYVLNEVRVSDREGNSSTYERGGPHGFDFAAADFSVENPLEDVTSPTVTSARLFRDEAQQGTPVVMLYSAEDDLSGVEEVTLSGWSPTGSQYTLRSLPGLASAGPATWLVPLAAASGEHEPSSILVSDNAGNSTSYAFDFGTTAYPPGATLPPHEALDPEPLHFTVLGTTGDRDPPTMTEFEPVTPNRRRLTDLVSIDYTAVDEGTGIVWVLAQWTDGRGHTIEAFKSCDDDAPLWVEIEDYRTTGTDWQLQYISFADYLNNFVVYRRDGTLGYQNTDPGPPTHPFDLSRADFHLEEGPPSEETLPRLPLHCRRIADVSLTLSDADVPYGDLVRTAGSVEGPASTIAEPVVAIHEHLPDGPRLVGVVQGDAGGGYRRSFEARRNSELTATFLGADGPRGAEPETSRSVSLTVRTKVRATLSAATIRSGESARLWGRALPGAGEVLLQRKAGGGWDTVGRVSSDDGAFSFVLRPPGAGTYRYRAAVASTPILAAGRTRTFVLRVTGG